MNNLAIFMAFVLIALTGNIYSQDLIILKNGEEVKSKVMEVTGNGIKYKKYSNMDGPVYSMKKSEIFMVKYQNGEKDVFVNNKSTTSENNVNKINKINNVNNDGVLKMRFNIFTISPKYYQGPYEINKSDFVYKIESNPVAYNHYHLGKNLIASSYIIGLVYSDLAMVL